MPTTSSIDWPSLLINLATFIAALTAVVFSWMGLQAQADQKIAEYRKEWVENLRIRLADFFAADFDRRKLLELKQTAVQHQREDHIIRWHDEYLRASKEAGRSYELIRLSLNANEAEHAELEKRLKILIQDTNAEPPSGLDVVTLARSVLKTEWDRVTREMRPVSPLGKVTSLFQKQKK